jgi:L-amino acid N-acyltransferase YncA
MLEIRSYAPGDCNIVWAILEPVLREGRTYALPRDMSREQALAYWTAPDRATFVAADGDGRIVGTYYLRANQSGGGAHVANCGYVTAADSTGRGIARAMCLDSLDRARAGGFRAMQFNFVIASNVRAVRLWQSLGFETVGRIPDAFALPDGSWSDALVMHRRL